MRLGRVPVGEVLCWFALVVTVAVMPAEAQMTSGGPASVGRPHNCINYYPVDLAQQGIEGLTTSFTIDENGDVHDLKVSRSSGNPDLDAAAMSCAAVWHYKPAMRDGKPVAVPWSAGVQFRVSDPLVPPAPLEATVASAGGNPLPPNARGRCSGPPDLIGQDIHGSTTVRFEIAETGNVQDVSVVETSGNKELDETAMSCAESWRYKPASHDGRPVAVFTERRIVWHGTPSTQSTPASPTAPPPSP